MARILAFLNVTLDGVAQAPGRPDEDPRGGFAHGGWATPYADPEQGKAVAAGMSGTGAIMLGRRTYLDFFSVWPGRTDNPFSAILDNTPKYVVSTTLAEPLPWQNSILITGDVPHAVAALKVELDRDIVVLGSLALTQSLLREGLLDILQLQIHPLALGTGRRLFADDGYTALELVDVKPSSTGVLMATYRLGG